MTKGLYELYRMALVNCPLDSPNMFTAMVADLLNSEDKLEKQIAMELFRSSLISREHYLKGYVNALIDYRACGHHIWDIAYDEARIILKASCEESDLMAGNSFAASQAKCLLDFISHSERSKDMHFCLSLLVRAKPNSQYLPSLLYAIDNLLRLSFNVEDRHQCLEIVDEIIVSEIAKEVIVSEFLKVVDLKEKLSVQQDIKHPFNVAIALSGGGLQAAIYHAGLLSVLDRFFSGNGKKFKLCELSAVSGGSITGAFYSHFGGEKFDDFIKAIKLLFHTGILKHGHFLKSAITYIKRPLVKNIVLVLFLILFLLSCWIAWKNDVLLLSLGLALAFALLLAPLTVLLLVFVAPLILPSLTGNVIDRLLKTVFETSNLSLFYEDFKNYHNLYILTFDEMSGKTVILSKKAFQNHPKYNLLDAIKASCAIPMIFKPIEINKLYILDQYGKEEVIKGHGVTLSDGKQVDNLALEPIILDHDSYSLVICSNFGEPNYERRESSFLSAYRIIYRMMKRSIFSGHKVFSERNKRHCEVIYKDRFIEAKPDDLSVTGLSSLTLLDDVQIDRIFEIGKKAGEKVIERLNNL